MLSGLPSEIVILLDTLKKHQGLRNRSQALVQLIEQEDGCPAHDLTMRKPALPGGLCELVTGLAASVWRALHPPS